MHSYRETITNKRDFNLLFQAFRTENEAALEDELKEAAEQAAAMRITEKKKERKSSESKDHKKEVCS